MEEGSDIVDCGREGVFGRFRVVERYDEDVLTVGEGAVPFVVVADMTDAEASPVDGEESWQGIGGGLVVGGGKEYSAQSQRDHNGMVGSWLGVLPDSEIRTTLVGLDYVRSSCARVEGFSEFYESVERSDEPLEEVDVACVGEPGK